jgi:hypothetical protein
VIQASHVSTGTTNNALALNPSGGNVGVGTTAPGTSLNVIGSTDIATYPANAISLFQATTSVVGVNDAGIMVGSVNGNTPYLSDYGSGSVGMALYTNKAERMRILANGNVGIGTTAPGQLLDITNATSVTPAIRIQNQYSAGYVSMGANLGVNSFIGLQAGVATTSALGTPPLVVTTDNRVGINTTTPAFPLTVSTSSSSAGFTHTNGTITVGSYVGGSAAAGWYGTASNHPLCFYTNDSAPQVTLSTSGTVGIGTTTPDSGVTTTIPNAKLSIRGGTPGANNGKARISIGGDSSHYSAIEGEHIGSGATTLSLMTCANYSINSGNPLTRMFIADTGYVGIGTNNPTSLLHVNGNIASNSLSTGNITIGITNAIYMYYISPTNHAGFITDGAGNLFIFTGVSGVANRLTVQYNGFVNINNLTTNGTVTTAGGIGQLTVSSDRRIKENIVYQSDTQQGLASILNLKPATYRLIGQADTYLGFIAQDLEQDIPLAVDGKKYEWQWEETDDGKPKFDANGDIVYKVDADGNRIVRPRGVSDRAIIATQTLAIQELSKKLDATQQQLAAKSASLDALIAWAQTMGYSASV